MQRGTAHLLCNPLAQCRFVDFGVRSAARGAGGRAIQELKQRRFVVGGQQVAIVQSGRQPIWRAASTHGIQVRMVDRDPEPAEE
jgi:hypothetical protein